VATWQAHNRLYRTCLVVAFWSRVQIFWLQQHDGGYVYLWDSLLGISMFWPRPITFLFPVHLRYRYSSPHSISNVKHSATGGYLTTRLDGKGGLRNGKLARGISRYFSFVLSGRDYFVCMAGWMDMKDTLNIIPAVSLCFAFCFYL
jgi:hypothetical protein